MIAKLLLCLVGLNHISLFPVHATDGGIPDDQNVTVAEVIGLLDNLLEDKQQLFTDLSMASTLCQVSANRIKGIHDVGIRRLELWDQQQNELIADYKDQINELLHRADAQIAACEESRERAEGSQGILGSQRDDLNELESINSGQESLINSISEDITETKEAILNSLNDSISSFNRDINATSQRIDGIHQFVDSRHCEYGLATLSPGETTDVAFKTSFDGVPTVAMSLVGFSVHLEAQVPNFRGDDEGLDDDFGFDLFSIDKNIDASAFGFTATVNAANGSDVELKHIYCSWMACQNLDQTSSFCPLD